MSGYELSYMCRTVFSGLTRRYFVTCDTQTDMGTSSNGQVVCIELDS